ncbi:MAG TPA: hypothetical protein DCX19_02380, partial [Alphaproteobacteria bacterium]|nr:hypothetical protein [Alphaproteobacteria bacterium]
MRFVTLHGLSVLNRRYRSVLIKCLLAGMVFLPHTASAYLNFDDATGTITVNQDSALENSVENIKTISFGNKKILDGQGHTLSGSDGGSLTLSTSGTTSGGSLNDITLKASEIVGDTTESTPVKITGKVVFDAATVSNINLNISNDANLVMNGTMQGGKLSGGAAAYSEGGIFNNVDITTFFGTAKNATFKNDNSFAFNNVKFSGTTTIYADNVSGKYTNSKDPDHKNSLYAGEKLVLKSSGGNGAGTWNLGDSRLYFRGGAVQGNLERGTLSFSDENSVFSGRLQNVTIVTPTAESWNWNGNIQIDEFSENVTLALGKDDAMVVPYTLTLTADANNISKVTINSDTTVNGNGHTLMANELYLNYFNAYLNNVKIKSNGDFSVTTQGGYDGNVLNLTNSSLSAANSITAGNINVNGTLTVDLYATAGDTTFSADKITGENGATVRFQTASNVTLSSTGTLKISNVLLDFADTVASVGSADFTNTRMKTNLKLSDSIRFGNASFKENNIITANSISAASITVSNGSLTLKNLDGTGSGVLNGNLTVNPNAAFTGNLAGNMSLYGHFTGDMQGDIRVSTNHDWSFNGKFNGNIEATFKDSVFDTTCLKLTQGSTIGSLTLERSYDSKSADVIVNSDLAVSNLIFNNKREQASSDPENAGKITGTGTLKVDKVTVNRVANAVSENQNVYFDGISIAALNDNLSFDYWDYSSRLDFTDSRYDFTNNAISAGNIITFYRKAVFNGNSSLTARHTEADDIIINGTLTVSGSLAANSITGGTDGTLNIVLPSSGTKGVIVSSYEPVSNVKLTFDLKNVKSKNAQQYFVVGSGNYGNYTIISGNYDKWAFSADDSFTLEDWKADKDAYKLTEDLWNKSQGTLWILKVAGGAESAINDLRMAGIYVSPTEENASKILDLISNNPFADRLTDLLDSGDAGLQKQALREIAPTDAASSAFKTAKSAAHAVMNAVSDRLGGASDVSGRSGGDLTAGESAAWAQGMFNRAKMTGGDGFTSGTAGFSAGVETNLTDEIKAGFGYAFASTGIKTGRSKINADTHTGFVYGEYAP